MPRLCLATVPQFTVLMYLKIFVDKARTDFEKRKVQFVVEKLRFIMDSSRLLRVQLKKCVRRGLRMKYYNLSFYRSALFSEASFIKKW